MLRTPSARRLVFFMSCPLPFLARDIPGVCCSQIGKPRSFCNNIKNEMTIRMTKAKIIMQWAHHYFPAPSIPLCHVITHPRRNEVFRSSRVHTTLPPLYKLSIQRLCGTTLYRSEYFTECCVGAGVVLGAGVFNFIKVTESHV